MSEAQNRKTGPFRRLGQDDVAVGGEFLKGATFYQEPDDLTQRRAFKIYMPELYVLRNKGVSFAQIALLLTHIGFNLRPATVRSYYNQFLAERMDDCQLRMTEQLALLAEVRKQIKEVDVSVVAEKLAQTSQRTSRLASDQMENVVGIRKLNDAIPATAAMRKPAPQTDSHLPANRQNKLVEDSPVVVSSDPSALTQIASNKRGALVPGSEPMQSAFALSSAIPTSRKLTCLPLRAGGKVLARRPHVDAAVYEAGDLEHPAIPGLILNLEQRLCVAELAYMDVETRESFSESFHEKRFRILWKKPIPMTPSSTEHTFVKMDLSLFSSEGINNAKS